MFLKDIRNNILTIPFTMLSNSLKTSLSEFFFFILNSSRFFFFFWLRFIAVEKSLFLYCVKLIEISSRHVTGCHLLDHEFHSAIGNKESVENNIIFHFCFCLPSPLKSPWPSDGAHFHKNSLAVHGSMLSWFMNVLDMLSCSCDRCNSFRHFSIWTK